MRGADSIATFPSLRTNKAASGYVLQAEVAGLPAVRSTASAITPGPAARLAFTVQPSNTTGGVAISPAAKVTIQDAYGNVVSTPARSLPVALGANAAGGALSGMLTATTAAGTATFSTLRINKVGRYTLTAATAACRWLRVCRSMWRWGRPTNCGSYSSRRACRWASPSRPQYRW